MVVMVMMIWRRRWWRPILRKWRGLCYDADTQQQSCGEQNYLLHVRFDAIYLFQDAEKHPPCPNSLLGMEVLLL
jgi:hypothetical protein